MPRFFFDVFDMTGIFRDDVGVEYETLDEVREVAVSELPILAQQRRSSGDRQALFIRVRDSSGEYVLESALTIVATWLKQPSPLGTTRAPP